MVADPLSLCVLPWAPANGWLLCASLGARIILYFGKTNRAVGQCAVIFCAYDPRRQRIVFGRCKLSESTADRLLAQDSFCRWDVLQGRRIGQQDATRRP